MNGPQYADLAQLLCDCVGAPSVALSTPLARTQRVETTHGGVFVKSGAAAQLAAEREGLEALARAGLPTPAILGSGQLASGTACLILEYIELQAVTSDAAGEAVADALANLHQQPQHGFGWAQDNFIGNTLQINAALPGWGAFFGQRRLAPQFAALRAAGHKAEWIRLGQDAAEHLAALFVEAEPAASMLHGDLWHGNIGLRPDGRPVFLDPAVYCGDAEADLAMSELFGGLPTRFYAHYRARHPLSANYETRKLAYNLYHILNHLQCFGRSYQRQAEHMTRQLSERLRRT